MKVLSWTNYCFSYFFSRSHCAQRKAAGGENAHNRLPVYYRARRHKHSTYSHSARKFMAYISSDCGKKLMLYPVKYSACKLWGPEFKLTLSDAVAKNLKPSAKQMIYKNMTYGTFWVSQKKPLKTAWTFSSNKLNIFGSKQPLALPQAKSPPTCACAADIQIHGDGATSTGVLVEEDSNDWFKKSTGSVNQYRADKLYLTIIHHTKSS